MCEAMVGEESETALPRVRQSKPTEKESQCLSPNTPLGFSKFAIETEWGEMEDFDEVAGGPLCVSHAAASSPGSYGFLSPTGSAQSWFDIRVIYLRVAGCALEEAPETLTIRFPPRSIGVALEVNGGWISPSEEACVALRRDRVDTETTEATYVSTDNIRMSETICFEVFNKEEALVSGTLEHSSGSQETGHGSSDSGSRKGERTWSMECCCVVGKSGCAFLKSRHDFSAPLSPPAMEVSMVGRHLDTPVFLTQTVNLIARRKLSRILTLDAIPETEELGKSQNDLLKFGEPGLISQRDAFAGFENTTSFSDFSDKFAAGISQLDDRLYGIEGDDGQMTWFNAGVRVGVGIGLGMCLGAGIGIGLMVRTYQVTTRTLRRVI
ncbi:hypothetical protein KC19_6G139500 [Ceratodon purpureus]|uniref:Uncharacterized protein n=1 Tax=Ceratodon purpureus TaxID=3225 RepID=A0A8T0HEC3_CERPU|nr:hypothetical protein KC19_6G139500 [Ceratodon purpureus]